MRKLTRFQIARNDIISHFQQYENKILSESEIRLILNQNRDFWRLSRGLTTTQFIDLLTESTKFKKYIIEFPNKRYTKYSWGPISIYRLALNLEPNSYLTHYTSMYLNDLTGQIPKTIYVNREQTAKRFVNRRLVQENIDRAFKSHQRESKNIATVGDWKICKLNGQFTGMLGVIEKVTQENESVMITNIERTLIDIAVRPTYSGGIHEVLNAYRRAAEKVSINRLTAMLKKINYIYPYSQAIGFYLQRAGVYKESQIQLLKNSEFTYDFYLAHGMKELEYSKEWRIYYPRGF